MLYPFLTEEDLALRKVWREDSNFLEGILNHLEKLGDAMDKVMTDTLKNQPQILELQC